MKRKRLLEPWPGPWKLWAEKFCRTNAWRVATYLGDYDDAVAECAYIFVECQKKYGDKVESPAHFMRLYQRMVVTWFHDWSNGDTEQREVSKIIIDRGESIDLDKLLLHKTRKCSSEVKHVVTLLLNAPAEAVKILAADCREVSDVQSASKFLRNLMQVSGIKDIDKVQKELHDAITSSYSCPSR